MELNLHDVLQSDDGYLIRPYLELKAKRNGYFWKKGFFGNWRGFMDCNVTHFNYDITGHKSNYNGEKIVSKAFYKGLCPIDDWKIEHVLRDLNPYVINGYFPNINRLQKFTKKFGCNNGARYAIGCDSHEAKLHAKFARVDNSTTHEYLAIMTNGAVTLDSSEKYYLTYEIRKSNVQIPLVEATSNKIKSVIYKQHFRKWCFVTSDELNAIKVCKLRDKNGTFFISNTVNVKIW